MTTSNTPVTPRRPGRGVSLIALTVAVLALVAAAFGAVQSWRAADQAGQALDRIDELAKAPVAAPAPVTEAPTEAPTEPPTDPPVTETADPGATGAVPELNAQTQYEQRYSGQNLRVPADCNATVYIDLDEPRVKTESAVSEFHYEDPCGPAPAYIALDTGVEGSLVPSSAVTPFECAEQIRTSPMSSDNQPVRRGQVYCIKTSLDTARASAGTWKMVLVEITATGQDGTVTFEASAWNIPD